MEVIIPFFFSGIGPGCAAFWTSIPFAIGKNIRMCSNAIINSNADSVIQTKCLPAPGVYCGCLTVTHEVKPRMPISEKIITTKDTKNTKKALIFDLFWFSCFSCLSWFNSFHRSKIRSEETAAPVRQPHGHPARAPKWHPPTAAQPEFQAA